MQRAPKTSEHQRGYQMLCAVTPLWCACIAGWHTACNLKHMQADMGEAGIRDVASIAGGSVIGECFAPARPVAGWGSTLTGTPSQMPIRTCHAASVRWLLSSAVQQGLRRLFDSPYTYGYQCNQQEHVYPRAAPQQRAAI